MPAHSTLTGADLHEPKGISGASANTVYVSNGAGSGTWQLLAPASFNSSSVFNLNETKLYARLTDVSTASFILIPMSTACTVTKVSTRLNGAITGADSIITCTNSTGPTSMGTITIANSGSAEGDLDTLTPVGGNTYVADSYLKIATDGASTNTVALDILIDITLTA